MGAEVVFSTARAEEIQEEFLQKKLQVPLAALEDVSTQAPNDGDAPIWNAALGMYVPGPAAGGSSNALKATVQAGATITAFLPVTIDGLIADNTAPMHFGKVAGIAFASALSGFPFSVVVSGLITNPLWAWTAGQPLFLVAGDISATAPTSGFLQQIGEALNPTTILVNIGTPVEL